MLGTELVEHFYNSESGERPSSAFMDKNASYERGRLRVNDIVRRACEHCEFVMFLECVYSASRVVFCFAQRVSGPRDYVAFELDDAVSEVTWYCDPATKRVICPKD